MARLNNPRHEAFAQYVHEGYTVDDAYERAGYKRNRHNAAALSRKQHIVTRLQELADRAERTTDVNLQSLTNMYFEAANMAKQNGDAQAYRGVVDSLAKLHGVWVDRQQVDNVTRVVSGEPMDENAWAEQFGADQTEAVH